MPRPPKQYTTEELQKVFFGNSKKEAKKLGLSTYNPYYNPKLLRRIDKEGFIKNKEIIDKELYLDREYRLILSPYPVNCCDRYHYELYTNKVNAREVFDIPYSRKLNKKERQELEMRNKIRETAMIDTFDFLRDKFRAGDRHHNNTESCHGIWKLDIPGEEYDNILHTNILSTHRLDALETIFSKKSHFLNLK